MSCSQTVRCRHLGSCHICASGLTVNPPLLYKFGHFMGQEVGICHMGTIYTSNQLSGGHLLSDGLHLFLGGTFNDISRATVVTRHQCSVIDQLSCSLHEEAHTIVIVIIHFTMAAFGCQMVFVHVTDTDVIILCMYHFCRFGIEKKKSACSHINQVIV